MKKFVVTLSSAFLAIMIAIPAAAQDITCADGTFDARIMTTYPAAPDACLAIDEVDGVRYARFDALVHREGFPTMLLRFKHTDDTWGPATLVKIPAGYKVYLEGQPVDAKDVPRGRQLTFYMPEGRWHVTAVEEEAMAVSEATLEPLEFEVVEMELTEEVDMEAPPLVVEEAPAEAEYEAAADEAAADEAPADEVEQEAATADYEDDGAPEDSEWLWILGLAGAFIIVWFLLRRKKARRED